MLRVVKKLQIKALVKKDLTVTLSHKIVWLVLIGPGLFIMALGLTPFVLQDSTSIAVFAISQDETFHALNLGLEILYEMKNEFENISYVEFYVLTDLQQALQKENLLWIPSNFTRSLLETKHSIYYVKCCAAGSFSCKIMTETVPKIIDDTVKKNLNETSFPSAKGIILPGSNLKLEQEVLIEEALRMSFIISYAIFLLTLMLGSVGRLAGFARDKNEGMLELVYSVTSNKEELIISKLVIAFVLSAISVISYGIGIIIVLAAHSLHGQSNRTKLDQETEDLFSVSSIFFKPINLVFITIALLAAGLMVVLISLVVQVSVPSDVSERFEGLILAGLSFLFFIGVLLDPIWPNLFLLLNPLYWPYRLLMGYFYPTLYSTSTYWFALPIIVFVLSGIWIGAKMMTRENFVLR